MWVLLRVVCFPPTVHPHVSQVGWSSCASVAACVCVCERALQWTDDLSRTFPILPPVHSGSCCWLRQTLIQPCFSLPSALGFFSLLADDCISPLFLRELGWFFFSFTIFSGSVLCLIFFYGDFSHASTPSVRSGVTRRCS